MLKHLLWLLIRWGFYISLPFVLLIRGGVYLHRHFYLQAWLTVLGGVVMASVILLVYWTLIQRRLFPEKSIEHNRFSIMLVFLVVTAYGFQSAFYLAQNHAKTDAIHAEFQELHPLLRLSVSTVILLDRKVLITDASRLPEDYKRMGMSSKKQSLHYLQKDGYTHAMDLRTRGQPAWRNALLQAYFKIMGFNTLRHGGNNDHLHVSLSSWDRPGSI
ncbi:MAG: hypothetical protein KDC28_15465 [Saprospiraceae bacterium]|nr:hypothetical protein [Saprospiraceae bacterium]MCB9318569.1 hypothetical protein [Lewinellaceae bacterium]